jgi:predicted outer membrane repeat protein
VFERVKVIFEAKIQFFTVVIFIILGDSLSILALAEVISISGGQSARIVVKSGSELKTEEGLETVFSDLVSSSVGSGAIEVNRGGIANLKNIEFLRNKSKTSNGGAIYSSGSISITDAALNNNSTDFNGGAICSAGSSVITNATLDHNSAGSNGGAICSAGSSVITNATLDHNSAYFGGAIYNLSDMNFTGTTVFSDNKADDKGGALYSEGIVNFDGNVVFSNNTTQGHYCGGAIYNDYKGGSINFNLPNPENYVKFENNKSGLEKNDIINYGSLRISGKGTFEMDGGINGLCTDGSNINVEGAVTFNIKDAKVEQNNVNFIAKDGENPLFMFTIVRFDLVNGVASVGGGAGGQIKIHSGEVSGSPVLRAAVSKSSIENIASAEYKYIYYFDSSINSNSYSPTIALPILLDDDGSYMEITFGEKNGLTDYTTLLFKRKVNLSQENLANFIDSGEDVVEFINTALETNPFLQEYIRVGDIESLKAFYLEHSPDADISSHSEMALAPLDVMSRLLGGRAAPTSNSIWLSSLGNFVEYTNSRGNIAGFAVGLDRRFIESNFTANLAYAFGRGSLEDNRITTNTVAFQLGHDTSSEAYLSSLVGYSLSNNSRGKLNYSTAALRLSLTAGYGMAFIKNLTHEISLRYSSTRRDKYSNGLGGFIDKVERRTLASVFGLRYRLAQSRYPTIDIRCGILYTLLNRGDKFQSVTLANGYSYRVADSGNISSTALEISIKIGYNLNVVAKNTAIEISYGGKYSKNLKNNGFSVSITFSL